jgi:aryl sulfotransferase
MACRLVPAALVLALAGAGAPAADDEACEQRGGECGAAAMRVELLQSGVKRADAVLVSSRRDTEVSVANRTSAPHTWSGWGTRLPTPALWATPESRDAAIATVLRPTDVVVLTHPKTGTTWLQQICEQLRTRGNMEFTEITERQPWLDLAYDCGVDMDADQHAEPRIFKSHQVPAAVSTGAKYISIVRDPADVLQSFFSFQKSQGILSFREFDDVNSYAASGHFETNVANLWEYYTQLWRAREDPNLLVQSYEELAKDESAYLPRIAEFLGVQLDEDLRQIVLDMSSKDFMLEHAAQFDDSYITSECSNAPLGNEDVFAEKVTTEQRDELTPATRAWLQALWDERVLPRTLLRSYDQMSAAFAALARGEHS